MVGQASARSQEETGNLSIGLLLTGLRKGLKDAPQNAGLARDGIASGGSLVAGIRMKVR
jgi:hypothetical protein